MHCDSLNELMQKITVAVMMRDSGLSVSPRPPLPSHFTVKILPKTSTLKSQLFCYAYDIYYTLCYLPFFLPFIFLTIPLFFLYVVPSDESLVYW